jgi:hypothetical protein
MARRLSSHFRSRLAVSVLALASLIASPRPAAAQLPPDFDACVERVRQVFNVPGLAVAVVEDGKVVFAKGNGAKRLNATIRDVRLVPVSPRADFSFDFEDLQLTPARPAGTTP